MKEFVNATFGLEKSFILEFCWKKFSNNFIPYPTFAFLSTFLLILLNLTNVAASLEIKAEAKSQLFFPASKRFRRIYGNCMGGYEGQVTVFFLNIFKDGSMSMECPKKAILFTYMILQEYQLLI
ncbi:hypothetical protein [Candidatus Protochlamydia amoebophila]|uniref:Uncharacterized protein n=1 Tax=Protochlamydia amoebophila (strain UWE25) TaxID=264201 RepID=Q6MCN8_PARUW|nr:hypothetical protein [Candidatus Protochlamydia amoebophila]CAF23661.1 unnamed protein product [Candidatus Protochlamydia amoebophila UWE25]